MGFFANRSGVAKLVAAFFVVVGPIATCEAYRENEHRERFRKESVWAPGEVIGGAKSRIRRQHNPDYYWLKFRFVSEDGKSREARCEVTPGLFNAHMQDGKVTKAETRVHYLAEDPPGSALLEKPRWDTQSIWGGVILFIAGGWSADCHDRS